MAIKEVKIGNKKANFSYHIKDVYTAGIQLTGTEVKSLRNNEASINEAYCVLQNGEVLLRNAHINIFTDGGYNNHIPKRDRKLLLNKKEIEKIEKGIKTKGYTLVPLEIFSNEKGLMKIKIGTALGKKSFDKREDLKLKDHKREMDRARKSR